MCLFQPHARHFDYTTIYFAFNHFTEELCLVTKPEVSQTEKPQPLADILHTKSLVVGEDGSTSHTLNFWELFLNLCQQRAKIFNLVLLTLLLIVKILANGFACDLVRD